LKKNKSFLTIVSLILALSQCREIEEPGSIGVEYYPLNTGFEWIYQIDSTYHESFSGESFLIQFQRKNKIIGTRLDPAGRLVYEIEQSDRKDSQDTWKYKETYFAHKDRVMVEENKRNIKTVPIIFPVKQNKVWDGNQLNNKGRHAFVYKKVGFSYIIDKTTYPETFMVEQIDDSTFFDQFRDLEYYGKNVGLLCKEHINITTKNKNKSGSKVIWKLLNYKN
jgi:hypothetical protein